MPAPERPGEIPGRFAYERLDRVIHERARLGILASLAAHDGGLPFNELKAVCSLTDGNLSRHLAVLGEARLVEAERGKRGTRPETRYRLTAEGRRRFTDYIAELQRVIADAGAESETTRSSPGFPPALSEG